MPLPSLPRPFIALGLNTCCSSHLQCPSHLFPPDKIHHSYLVYPSSSASSSVRHFLALPGNCFSYNLLCTWELHSNSHCGTSMKDYALWSLNSFSHQSERRELAIHMWTWTIPHFIIPSVKYVVRNSNNVQVTGYDPALVCEGRWVTCWTGFREEGQKWTRERLAGTCSYCDSLISVLGVFVWISLHLTQDDSSKVKIPSHCSHA